MIGQSMREHLSKYVLQRVADLDIVISIAQLCEENDMLAMMNGAKTNMTVEQSRAKFEQIAEALRNLPGRGVALVYDEEVYAAMSKACMDTETLIRKLNAGDQVFLPRLAEAHKRISQKKIAPSECLSIVQAAEEHYSVPHEEEEDAVAEQSRKVFIIHGHDYAAALELEKLLRERFPRLQPVILANEPWSGTTVIEKFEREAKHCGFAFAVFTPDDNVSAGNESYHQMRPNVIYELGWFHSQVGRANTCILYKRGTQIPTDLQGLGWCPFDTSVTQAFIDIEKELKAAYGDNIS